MKKFVYDSPVTGENFCNLSIDRQKLNLAVHRGERVVLYGRRNTGKDLTSITRRGRYEEQLLRYSHDEQLLLVAIARFQPIIAPQ